MQPDPHIAFGMKAVALAMKAKSGTRLSLVEVAALANYHQFLIPRNRQAALAVTRFIAEWQSDPLAAGNALHEFLLTWRKRALAQDARRTDEVIAEIPATCRAPPVADIQPQRPQSRPQIILHDWQTRPDTGID